MFDETFFIHADHGTSKERREDEKERILFAFSENFSQFPFTARYGGNELFFFEKPKHILFTPNLSMISPRAFNRKRYAFFVFHQAHFD